MTVTYAGIPLEPPDPQGELQSLLERYWHERRISETDHPAYLTHGIDHLPIPYPPKRECPRLGILHWPTGASRWGTYHALVHSETVDAISAAVSTPAVATLVVSDGTNSISPPMWLLPFRPVCQKGTKELYLLSLVDERWFWWLRGELKAPDDPATWAELLTALFAAAGLAPTLPTIPAGYSTPDPGRWAVGYKPTPLLIDAACATVGLRVYRTLAGVVGVVGPAAANGADTSNWALYSAECLTGGRLTARTTARGLPASVAVIFPAPDPDASVKELRHLPSLGLSDYSGVSAVAGAYAQINADLPASADAALRSDYATQAASDYYLWALSPTDATFRGVVPWGPTGSESCVEWAHHPDRILTRVIRDEFHDRNVYGSAPKNVIPLAMMTDELVDLEGNYQYAKRIVYNDNSLIPGLGHFYEATPPTLYEVESMSGSSDAGASRGWTVGQVVFLYPSADRVGKWRAVAWKAHEAEPFDGLADGSGLAISEITGPGGTGSGYTTNRYSQVGHVTTGNQWIGGPKAFVRETAFGRGLRVNSLGLVSVIDPQPPDPPGAWAEFNKFRITAGGEIWTNQTLTTQSVGQVQRVLPIYNEFGSLVGWIPIYNGYGTLVTSGGQQVTSDGQHVFTHAGG